MADVVEVAAPNIELPALAVLPPPNTELEVVAAPKGVEDVLLPAPKGAVVLLPPKENPVEDGAEETVFLSPLPKRADNLE